MIDLRSSRFYDLLPPNLRTSHTAALSHAFDRQMRDLAGYIPIVYILALVERLDEAMCDQVAMHFNLAEYRFDADLAAKREYIRFAFQISARKGTAWAVDKLVTTVFGSAKTDEWFDYGGDPYFFRIRTSNPLAAPEDYSDFLSAVDETKSLRSWLEAIILELQGEGRVYLGMAVHDAAVETARLTGDVADLTPPPVPVYCGVAYHEISIETTIMK